MSNCRLKTEFRKTEIKSTIVGGVLGAEKCCLICLLWPWLSLESCPLSAKLRRDATHERNDFGATIEACFCCCAAASIVLCYWQSNFQLRVNPQQPHWFSQAVGRPGVVLIGMRREDIVGTITVAPQGLGILGPGCRSSASACGYPGVLSVTEVSCRAW